MPGHEYCRECHVRHGRELANPETVPTQEQLHKWEMENDGLRPAEAGNLMSRYKALMRHRLTIGGDTERWQAQITAQSRLQDVPNIELVAADEEAEHNLKFAELDDSGQDKLVRRIGEDSDAVSELAFRYRFSLLYRTNVRRLPRENALAHVRELYYLERGFQIVAAKEEKEHKERRC